MKKSSIIVGALALGMVTGLGSCSNAGDGEEVQNNATGEGADATEKAADHKCGEGKCGEGKCGDHDHAEGDSTATADKSAEAKCGEGKCGGDDHDHEGHDHAEGEGH